MEDIVKPFSETEIRNWCFYMFQGLVYMHQHDYFHCDFKPGIFFLNDYVGLIVKEYESIEGLVRENLKKLPEANQKLLIYPLFSSLPSEKQMKVFTSAPVGFRNVNTCDVNFVQSNIFVILATNIVETSVTIPGVKYVSDPGLVKVRNYSPDSGIKSLTVVKTSKAQALQRR
ncbi:putative RNA helicase [Helianthus anomalus]